MENRRKNPPKKKKSKWDYSKPKALVLVPTRELAHQIESEARKFTKLTKVNCLAIYGGTSKSLNIKDMRRNDIEVLIATPGRCFDLINMGELDPSQVQYLVLDEADRM